MSQELHLARLAAISMLAVATICQADGFSVGIDGDYSSGKYGGTDRTSITSVPMYARFVKGPLTFKASVSWLSVSGTGAIIPSGLGGISGSGGESGASGGSGGSAGVFGCAADNRSGASKPEDNGPCATTTIVGGGGAAALRRTERGFGDIVAAVTYNAFNTKGLMVDVSGKIKFATASDTKGLGSGKMDYALQFEGEQSIGKGYVNGGIGYKWLGDPTGVTLNNVWYGALGGGIKLSDTTNAGISYDYATAARSGGTAFQGITLYATQRLSGNVKLNGNIFKGLSNGSADWGAGIGLRYDY